MFIDILQSLSFYGLVTLVVGVSLSIKECDKWRQSIICIVFLLVVVVDVHKSRENHRLIRLLEKNNIVVNDPSYLEKAETILDHEQRWETQYEGTDH